MKCAAPDVHQQHAQVRIVARTHSTNMRAIAGPMFAGKSSALLHAIELAESAHQRVLVVTSALDDRAGPRTVATHDGARRDAVAVHDLADLERPGSEVRAQYDMSDVVAIDEAQFFPDLRPFVLRAVEQDGKAVVVAGLNGDFRRAAFGDVVGLVPLADAVTFLSARCSFCARPAPFTLRVAASESQVLVGGSDAYRPVCRDHYRELGIEVRASASRGGPSVEQTADQPSRA